MLKMMQTPYQSSYGLPNTCSGRGSTMPQKGRRARFVQGFESAYKKLNGAAPRRELHPAGPHFCAVSERDRMWTKWTGWTWWIWPVQSVHLVRNSPVTRTGSSTKNGRRFRPLAMKTHEQCGLALTRRSLRPLPDSPCPSVSLCLRGENTPVADRRNHGDTEAQRIPSPTVAFPGRQSLCDGRRRRDGNSGGDCKNLTQK